MHKALMSLLRQDVKSKSQFDNSLYFRQTASLFSISHSFFLSLADIMIADVSLTSPISHLLAV